MALFSAFGLVRGVAMLHLTLAYFLLTNPYILVNHNLVLILGKSMHLPMASSFSKPSQATGFLAVIFAFLGLIDMTSTALPDHVAYEYWSAQIPMRLLFLFGLTGYTYLSSPSSAVSKLYPTTPGDMLRNGFLFTWAFIALIIYFLVFLTLREERRQRTARRLGAN